MLMCSTVVSTTGKYLSGIRVCWVLEIDGRLETGSECEGLSGSQRPGQVQIVDKVYSCVFCEGPTGESPCCSGNCLKSHA